MRPALWSSGGGGGAVRWEEQISPRRRDAAAAGGAARERRLELPQGQEREHERAREHGQEVSPELAQALARREAEETPNAPRRRVHVVESWVEVVIPVGVRGGAAEGSRKEPRGGGAGRPSSQPAVVTGGAVAAQRLLCERALFKGSHKKRPARAGFVRFDSATRFTQEPLRSCSSERAGSLLALRPEQDAAALQASGPWRPAPRSPRRCVTLAAAPSPCADPGLRALSQAHAGAWALERSGRPEFSDGLTSALCKLSGLCGSVVARCGAAAATANAAPRTDAWALAGQLDAGEQRALAALVAEMVLGDMRHLAREAAGSVAAAAPASPARSMAAVPATSAPETAAVLAPAPAPAPAQGRLEPHRPSRERKKSFPPSARETTQAKEAELADKAAALPSLGSALALPPSKEFWKNLATYGLSHAEGVSGPAIGLPLPPPAHHSTSSAA
jgi:hypothetical protein